MALAENRWRTVASSGFTFLFCSVISGLLFGFDQWADFYEAVRSCNLTMGFMCNWFAPVLRFMPEAESALHTAGMPVMLIGAGALSVYCLVDKSRGDRSIRHLAVASAVAPLVSPNTHPYDLIIWLVPVCLIARRGVRYPTWVAVALTGLGVLVLMAAHLRWLLPVVSGALAIAAAIPVGDDPTRMRNCNDQPMRPVD